MLKWNATICPAALRTIRQDDDKWQLLYVIGKARIMEPGTMTLIATMELQEGLDKGQGQPTGDWAAVLYTRPVARVPRS